jgi:hypothetical protein
METHEQQTTQPRGVRREPIYKVVYHPADSGGDSHIERRLNKAFDVLFAKVPDIDS